MVKRCRHITSRRGVLLEYGTYLDYSTWLPLHTQLCPNELVLLDLGYLRGVCHSCKASSRTISRDLVTMYLRLDTIDFDKTLLVDTEYYLQTYHNFLEVLFDNASSYS